MRSALAILLGVAVAGFAVMVVEMLGHAIYPPPAGLAGGDVRAVEAYVASAPIGALASVLVAWAAGAFAGSAVAARISGGDRPQRAGIFVGGILFVMAILNMSMIPHPAWFLALSPVACLLPALLGARLGARRPV